MIQIKSANLEWQPGSTGRVVSLSSTEDLRWAGVLYLLPFAALQLDADAHYDFYLLRGSLLENSAEYVADTFISRSGAAPAVQLQAGAKGATLFMYRDRIATRGENKILQLAELDWFHGRVSGMTIAPLSDMPHRLMLVSWLPETRAGFHIHPRGEEIFVLKGELQDQHRRYPMGSWQRLPVGSGHAPFSQEATLILLRSGHLRSGE